MGYDLATHGQAGDAIAPLAQGGQAAHIGGYAEHIGPGHQALVEQDENDQQSHMNGHGRLNHGFGDLPEFAQGVVESLVAITIGKSTHEGITIKQCANDKRANSKLNGKRPVWGIL
ncbi:hypothetical protein [Pseudomonas oryzihabitans]|uniref:hypothetical protein n=1 Tax=Pseudomonas oryzihabitans TaxID=47885 RepID=UPI0021591B78|nr:hypothetical protein [Pseudomonas psychrotolerans]